MSEVCKDARGRDCFAYTPKYISGLDLGYCNCLSDTNFNGECPFFKPKDQVELEQMSRTARRLSKYKK